MWFAVAFVLGIAVTIGAIYALIIAETLWP